MPKSEKHRTGLPFGAESYRRELEEVLHFRKKPSVDKLGWSLDYKNQLEVEAA